MTNSSFQREPKRINEILESVGPNLSDLPGIALYQMMLLRKRFPIDLDESDQPEEAKVEVHEIGFR